MKRRTFIYGGILGLVSTLVACASDEGKNIYTDPYAIPTPEQEREARRRVRREARERAGGRPAGSTARPKGKRGERGDRSGGRGRKGR